VLWVYNQNEFEAGDGDYRSLSVHYGINTKTGKLAVEPVLEYIKSTFDISTAAPVPLTDGKAADCRLTLEQALAYADAEVHALCPDYEMTSYGQLPVWETVKNPRIYSFRYTRHINGVAVNDADGGESMANDYGYTSGLGVITVAVRDDGVCYLSYSNPYDCGRIIEQDSELLTFAQIMDIFGKMGILSIQYLERYEDLQENTMEVYKIQFGYMAVRQPDNIDAYYYVPVWDFYAHRTLWGTGGYAHGKDLGLAWGKSCLTINAIDGTIIDRTYGY
jgi:hypothetical protein